MIVWYGHKWAGAPKGQGRIEIVGRWGHVYVTRDSDPEEMTPKEAMALRRKLVGALDRAIAKAQRVRDRKRK